MTRPNYREYIVSKEWRDKHKEWLKQAGHRCAFTLLPLKHYNMHHLDYINLGEEQYGRDVLASSKWFHNLVIHGVLSGFKSAGKQGDYPNRAQKIVHAWGRLPYKVKQVSLWGFLLLGTYGIAASTLFLSGLQLPSESVKPAWGTSSQFVVRSAVKASRKLVGGQDARTNLLPRMQNNTALPVGSHRPRQPTL